jgi:hypothetical protein
MGRLFEEIRDGLINVNPLRELGIMLNFTALLSVEIGKVFEIEKEAAWIRRPNM